ncbi:MAG: hypothetical protein M1836_006430 [Candelina mexicana]|nr:MAG: hypothetical protein M1836_006430 [Candelina mexicana]
MERRHRDPSEFVEIVDIIQIAPRVHMDGNNESEDRLAADIDKSYGNIFWFNPGENYPASMYTNFGKDWADNARGIYYSDDWSEAVRSHATLLPGRNLFIPSFKQIDWESPHESNRRRRARMAMKHALDNSKWNKSEYAWEADAWRDIFGHIRNDPLLALDKREYLAYKNETDPVSCLLTGKRTLEKRIPDATFGLSTYQGLPRKNKVPGQNGTFREDRLKRLLYHRKCGLISDPKWDAAKLVFPWAVYEAKGWAGDCREARRQACAGAARYLHMLDHLAHTPGPQTAKTGYQTPSSHDFQVFAITSFGAYWHVLVGFRHDRTAEQHAGTSGLSKKVASFRKIWSGAITNERGAWELIYLIDRIQHYARNHFRDFVMYHLDNWHDYCSENYMFDWDSDDESGSTRKRKHELVAGDTVRLPRWCEALGDAAKEKVKQTAEACLTAAFLDEDGHAKRLKMVKQIFPYTEEYVDPSSLTLDLGGVLDGV